MTDSYRQLNYKGDRRGAIGQIVGPTLAHEMLTIYDVDYDPETDRSVAHLRPATVDDVEAQSART